MRAKVDEGVCCGCGPCEEICPAVFHIEDDIAKVLKDPVPPDQEELVRQAMDRCPTGAITIEE